MGMSLKTKLVVPWIRCEILSIETNFPKKFTFSFHVKVDAHGCMCILILIDKICSLVTLTIRMKEQKNNV